MRARSTKENHTHVLMWYSFGWPRHSPLEISNPLPSRDQQCGSGNEEEGMSDLAQTEVLLMGFHIGLPYNTRFMVQSLPVSTTSLKKWVAH